MSQDSLKILYVGALWEGSTCLQRMDGLCGIGHNVEAINTKPDYVRQRERQLINRIQRKLLGPSDIAGVNTSIIQAVYKKTFDVLWVDKGVSIKRKTLKEIKRISPKTILVHYNPDDPFGDAGKSNWKTFLKALPEYDIHLVPREPNVIEYQHFGAKKVVQVVPFWGYSPRHHYPMSISPEIKKTFGGPVGFVGDYEINRANSMLHIAKKGILVRVWGPNWGRKFKSSHKNMKVEGRALFGYDYGKALCSFNINLAFLRKIYRDLHTSRTIEIPACGGFMLAERTDEHLALFEEGKEAEFFGSNEELLDKVKYYLSHPDQRKRIAAAGRQRCLRSGYSNLDRMREMLKVINKL